MNSLENYKQKLLSRIDKVEENANVDARDLFAVTDKRSKKLFDVLYEELQKKERFTDALREAVKECRDFNELLYTIFTWAREVERHAILTDPRAVPIVLDYLFSKRGGESE